MASFATYTLGCKVNQSETSQIENILQKQGYRLVDFKNSADIYIINTCSVTQVADRKSRQIIRRSKKINPQAKIIVAGCYAENKINALNTLKVDHIIKNQEKLKTSVWHQILPIIKQAVQQGPSKVRRMLKVQDGCSTFCSYCIVPSLRSEKTSLPLPEIIEKSKEYTAQGAREIVLTGVNLGNYNWQGHTLLNVLKELSKLNDLYRIRISSLELPDLSNELVAEIKTNKKICKHLHLPLQSGSDNILKSMSRPYTVADFIEKTTQLRQAMPEIAITTDVIVGFPGESDQDFQNTVNTIKKIDFSKLHIFKYSPRSGTPASKYKDQVQQKIAHERSKRLLTLSDELENSFAKKYLNKPLQVLFEEEDQRSAKGWTSNYLKVKTKQKDVLGKLVSVTPMNLDKDNSLSC